MVSEPPMANAIDPPPFSASVPPPPIPPFSASVPPPPISPTGLPNPTINSLVPPISASISTTISATPPIGSSITSVSDSVIPITTPISVKLNQENFLTWQAQILPLIHGYNLTRFLNSPSPNSTRQASDGQLEFNPDYLSWHRQDQLLLGWLRASLTESAQAQLVSFSTSASLWSALQQQFSTNSFAKILEPKRQLQSVQKSTSSCTEFLTQIRKLADELTYIGAPPSNDELVLSLLNGLGSDYNAFVPAVTATSRREALSFSDLHGLLLSHELCCEVRLLLNQSYPLPSTRHVDIPIPDGELLLPGHKRTVPLNVG